MENERTESNVTILKECNNKSIRHIPIVAPQKAHKKQIKVNFLPVDGDMIEAIFKALEPRVNTVLSTHGATLKMDLKEIVRNHAKV